MTDFDAATLMENSSNPDFEELGLVLRALNADVGAADFHGSLCGFLSGGGQGLEQFLVAMSLDQLGHADAQSLALVGQLFRSSDEQMDDDSFAFSPLLPEMDRPLSERTEALLQWCQGFVGGLGLGGFADEKLLSADGREVLHDLIEISRTPVSLDEDEEVDETALAELIEFARVGALLLREDLRAPRKASRRAARA